MATRTSQNTESSTGQSDDSAQAEEQKRVEDEKPQAPEQDQAVVDTAPQEAPAPVAEVTSQHDPAHRLSRGELSRVFAEGGSIVHGGEIYSRMEDLPGDYAHGKAHSLDSPNHPTNLRIQAAQAKLRAIQNGTWIPEQPSE